MSKWALSLTLADFSLLANYFSVKLTSEKIIKVAEDCNYLISKQILPEPSFDFFNAAQTSKFLLNNDTISYVICLAN